MDIKPIADEHLERSVIASSMLSDTCLHEMTTRLVPNSFYNYHMREIAKELFKLPSKGASVDLTLLSSKLGQEYFPTLTKLVSEVATSSNIAHHCKKLKDIENVRNVSKRAVEVYNRAIHTKDDEEYIHWGLDHVSSFYEGNEGNSQLKHIREYIPEAINEFELVSNGTLKGLMTGIADLDKESGGFRQGEYVVIAGRPSQGKTSLGLSMLKNIAMQGKRVGLFSLEMTGKQNVFKLTSMIAGTGRDGAKRLPYGVFRGSKPTKEDTFNSFSESCGVLSSKEIFVNTFSGTSVSDIENELRRFCKKNKLDAFFVDYIGLVKDDAKSDRKNHEKVAEISGRIRDLIKDLQVVGFVIVQLNRDSHNKKPTMANLADSTQIERDAHFVYLIHQPDLEDKTKKVIICDKGRDGGEGDFPTHFCTDTTEFTSMSKEESDIYMKQLKGTSEEESSRELRF
jgi:replicative DNA helicase